MKTKLLLLFILIHTSLSAQTWEWVKSAGGTSWNVAYDIITDDAGNNFVCGGFFDTAYFGNIQITGTEYTMYLAKYAPNGNVVWAKSFGGPGEDYAMGLSFDNIGGIYMTGVFTDSAFFDTDTLITTNGVFDAFLAHFDTAGNFLWVKQCGEPNNDQWGNAVSADRWGNAYVTGMFRGNTTFGTLQMNSIGNEDMFLVKFSPAGNSIWAKQAGGAFGTGAGPNGDIVTDKNGNSYITSEFGTTITWGTFSLTANVVDAYVARYDSSGTCLWVRKGGGRAGDGANGIAMDKQKNVFITGEFRDTAIFGNDSVFSHGLADIFIAKYDSLGNILWVRDAGGFNNDYGMALATDTLGNCYGTGMFLNSAYFGTALTPGFGVNDVYVAKYSVAGNFDWVKIAGGGSGSDRGTGISRDGNGNIFVTGDHAYNASFDTITVVGDPWVPYVFIGKIAPDELATGILDPIPASTITVYPNPGNGNMTFEYQLSVHDKGELKIYDVSGRLLKNYVLCSGQNSLAIHETSLENGMYIYQYAINDKQVQSGKLIILK